jgi:hypothetical protein
MGPLEKLSTTGLIAQANPKDPLIVDSKNNNV